MRTRHETGQSVNRRQRRNQWLIGKTLNAARLITSLRVAEGHVVHVESLAWEDYWSGAASLGGELERLKTAWTSFIDSGHLRDQRTSFVRAYFALLHACLNAVCRGEVELQLLRRVHELSGPVARAVLRPEKLIAENQFERIEHSLKRFRFGHGTAFHQFSLSSYFKAIHTIVNGASADGDDMIYVPVRQFDENSLVLPNGQPLIGQLMTLTERMVIEDADLSAFRLQCHIDRFGLNALRITDLTRRTRMRGASVCLIERTR